MNTTIKVKSFVKSFIAAVTGDDTTQKAEKVFRQAQSALNTQISVLTGDTVGKEDAVTEAKDRLSMARINSGNTISDRPQYVANLLAAKNALTSAETELEKHTKKLEFLKEELAHLESEVDA